MGPPFFMVIFMGKMMQPLNSDQLKSLKGEEIRKAYDKLACAYSKISEGDALFCHKCNGFYSCDTFYPNKKYDSGYFPICKKCLLNEACDYDKDKKCYKDNREKTMKVFRKLDLPFFDSVYQKCLKDLSDPTGEKNWSTAYQHMLTIVRTSDQFKRMGWDDSDFTDSSSGDEIIGLSKRKPRREIVKLFGWGFSNDEYLYLQDQYDDWCSRTQVDSKSQQIYVTRICHKLLDIWRAEKNGDDTTKLDESLNKLMDAANLQPKQNVSNTSADTLTLGQLIEKWEEEEPIPEPDPELADVDNIGKNLRVWFGGWLAHALGLNVPISKEYEEEVKKYTVEVRDAVDESNSSDVYRELFGGDVDEQGVV